MDGKLQRLYVTKYQYLSDFDKKNAFDIEKFLSTKLKLKGSDVYEVYDMSKEEDKALRRAMNTAVYGGVFYI